MTPRRLAAATFALALLLAVSACSSEDTLAEPDLAAQPAAEETEAEAPEAEETSTTVSTVSETETVAAEKPAKKNDKGPCEWTPVEEAQTGDVVQTYCDGHFASIGQYQTDQLEYVYWDGEDWVSIERGGRTYTGFNCYDEAHLDDIGVPAELKEKMILCD